MSERYAIKTTLDFTQSALDCPVQLSKYQIIYDNLIGKQFLRIALTCYTKVGIYKTSVSIECRDRGYCTIEKLNDVIINEQCNKPFTDFGKTVLIEIPNDTSSIKCTINQVVLCDGSKWTNTNESAVGNLGRIDYKKMPYLGHLNHLIASVDKNKILARIVPIQHKNYWQCTCGHLNSNTFDVCPCCGVDKKAVFTLFDEEFLRKDSIYYSANSLYKSKNYLDALNSLAKIPGYKNSKELSDKCIKGYLSDTLAPTETNPSIKTFEDCILNLQEIEKYTDIKLPLAYVERKRSEYVERIYQTAIKTANTDKTVAGYTKSIKLLEEIKDYKSVQKEIDDCNRHINDLNKATRHRKNIHRIIAAATAVFVAILAILIPVFIDGKVYETHSNFTLEECDNGYVLTGYKGNKASVNIPSSYLGTPIVKIGEKAFERATHIKRVIIPDNVKSIGSSAFYYCSELIGVTLCSRITSIGDYAFAYCFQLKIITIPNSVTYIGVYAFSDCHWLRNITYQGTTAQWNAISKGYGCDYNVGNYNIGRYIIHCTDGDIAKSE
ncbi:MAG: leucine-rich repeat domain-containing protein, partial [Clostridia bacterium]|nr:leucine-rich repeat domain-containing protein [Clostridia bacterium]